MARFQKAVLYLVSDATPTLRFRTNCRVITAGMPTFSRETHDAGWGWRPCHEAAALVARCATRRVLRLSIAQFCELLKERLLPLAELHLGGEEAPGAQLPVGGVLVVAARGCGAVVEHTTLVGVVSASRLMIQAERAKRASLLEALSE